MPAQLQCTLCRPGVEHLVELGRNFERSFLEIRVSHCGGVRAETYRYARVWEAYDAAFQLEHSLPGSRLVIDEESLRYSYRQSRPRGYNPEMLDPRGRPLGPAALPPSIQPAPAAPGFGFSTLLGLQIMVDPAIPSDVLYFIDRHGVPCERITGLADEYRDAIIRPDGTVPANPPPPGSVLDMETLQRAFRRLNENRITASSIVVSPAVHAQLTRLYTDPLTGERVIPRPQSRTAQDPGSDDPLEDQDAN